MIISDGSAELTRDWKIIFSLYIFHVAEGSLKRSRLFGLGLFELIAEGYGVC